jgi:hypothetical protein
MIDQSETLSSSYIICTTLFFVGAQRLLRLSPICNQPNCVEPKPVYVGFSSSNFTVQDHILNIAKDAFKRGSSFVWTPGAMKPSSWMWPTLSA